jgi:hypothetical protein
MAKGTAISRWRVGVDAMDVSVTSAEGGTHDGAIARELIPRSRQGFADFRRQTSFRELYGRATQEVPVERERYVKPILFKSVPGFNVVA